MHPQILQLVQTPPLPMSCSSTRPRFCFTAYLKCRIYALTHTSRRSPPTAPCSKRRHSARPPLSHFVPTSTSSMRNAEPRHFQFLSLHSFLRTLNTTLSNPPLHSLLRAPRSALLLPHHRLFTLPLLHRLPHPRSPQAARFGAHHPVAGLARKGLLELLRAPTTHTETTVSSHRCLRPPIRAQARA